MKIALCYSGSVRNFLNHTDTHIQMVNRLSSFAEVDTFFHSWHNEYKSLNIRGVYCSNKYSHFDNLIYFISPIDYEIEDTVEFDRIYEEEFKGYPVLLLWEQSPKYNILSQLYSLMKSDLLRRKHEQSRNFKYDCVVRMRFDNGLVDFAESDFSLFNDKRYDKCVITNNGKLHTHPGGNKCLRCVSEHIKASNDSNYEIQIHDDLHDWDFCDIFAIGSSLSMSRYSDLFNNIKSLYPKFHKDQLQTNDDRKRLVSCKKNPIDSYLNPRTRIERETRFYMFYPEALQRRNLQGYLVLPSITHFKVLRY